jgi:hypothetical protein
MFPRLDNRTWSVPIPENADGIDEIRVVPPPGEESFDAYAIALLAQGVLKNYASSFSHETLRRGIVIENITPKSTVQGVWHMSSLDTKWTVWRIVDIVYRRVKQWFPMTRVVPRRNIVTVTAHKISDHVNKALFRHVICKSRYIVDNAQLPVKIETLKMALPPTIREYLATPAYADPFTRLATICLETVERDFVMEADHRGQYRYVVDDGVLRLATVRSLPPSAEEPDKLRVLPPSAQEQEENRRAVQAYQQFLLKEYGEQRVAQIELMNNIHFDEMRRQGLPLYPDHVFKCNVGANNIECGHVQAVWEALCSVTGQAMSEDEYVQRLSGRVVRKLLDRCGTIDKLPEYIATLTEQRFPSISDGSPELFNEIVTLVWPTDDERDRSYTGRKIRHLAIMGSHTMGTSYIANACRDDFELQHIFSDLVDPQWWHFYELMAHVVSKKSLFRQTPPDGTPWHVGLLIPGPNGCWYKNSFFLDDNAGNVNYVAVPACSRAKTPEGTLPPLIKFWRSTASDGNAVSWLDSIEADFNPFASPCLLNPNRGYPYEKQHITDRTIPLWVGLLLTASGALTSRRVDFATKAYKEFIQYLHDEKISREQEVLDALAALCERGDAETLIQALMTQADSLKELPDHKIQQPLVFTGHSLGGSNCQLGTYFFLCHHKRLPLPNQDFVCFSCNGPAIGNDQDRQFMEFGRTYRDVFSFLHSSIHVYHQFERGDVVPKAGGSHLGTNDPCSDDDVWLKTHMYVFSPLDETARALSITTCVTHGRRIGTAQLGRDYSLSYITPSELASFDHAYILQGRIREIFGYRLLLSPKLTEIGRRILGTILYLPLRALDAVIGRHPPNPDEHNVVALMG